MDALKWLSHLSSPYLPYLKREVNTYRSTVVSDKEISCLLKNIQILYSLVIFLINLLIFETVSQYPHLALKSEIRLPSHQSAGIKGTCEKSLGIFFIFMKFFFFSGRMSFWQCTCDIELLNFMLLSEI